MSKASAKLCGVTVLVLLLVFAALGPANWQLRSGLGWQIDHVVGYFGFTLMFCLAWPRPLRVGGALLASAVLLECLQALTPDRHFYLPGALYSAAGALTAALCADLFMRARLNARALLVPQRFSARTRLMTASRRDRVPGMV
jgi:VanZ family protein